MNIILAFFLFVVFYFFGIFTAGLFAGAKVGELTKELAEKEKVIRTLIENMDEGKFAIEYLKQFRKIGVQTEENK